MKKRKIEPLVAICEEIEFTNNKKWKKWTLDEIVLKRNKEAEEQKELERQNRLKKSQARKEELLQKIRNNDKD